MDDIEELTLLLGKDSVDKLVAYYGGQSIYIPKRIIGNRNDDIKQKFETLISSGSTCMNSYQVLAKDHSLSVRMVQKICNETNKHR